MRLRLLVTLKMLEIRIWLARWLASVLWAWRSGSIALIQAKQIIEVANAVQAMKF